MKNSRIKLRKLKSFFSKIIKNIKFRIETFSFSKIIIFVGILIWLTSLFLNHISPIYSNIFNRITNFLAFILIISFSICLFLIFSYNKKEKIKKQINILSRDYIIINIISIIIFTLSVNNIFIINWLQTFDSNIKYWSWSILLIISSIFLFIGSILLKNDYESWKKIYLNDSPELKQEEIEKNNTKLPF